MRRRLGFITAILLSATALVVAPGSGAVGQPGCVAGAGPIISGADGNLWVGEANDDEIARVPAGGGSIAEFPLDLPFLERKMVLDPDGNVWVSSSFRSLSRVTPTGTIDTFDLPVAADTTLSSANGLTVGPDGNIWVLRTMNGDDRLTRVTPGGVVTDFQIDAERPSELVSADGFLWFFDDPGSAMRLFRSDTAANVSLHKTFVFNGPNFHDLITGPDGALWAINQSHHALDALVRIPTDGSDTADFPLPVADGFSPRSLTAGPDGRLWLAHSSGGPKLIAMTTAGAGTVYPQPSGMSIAALTSGPDGNLWFAGGNDVGSVDTSGALVSSRPLPVSTGTAIACEASPAFGGVAGGDTITLRGRGLDNVTAVWFDAYRAPSFSVVSDRELTVVTPAHPRGRSVIELDTVAGRQPFNAVFRFAVPPVAASLCPSLGSTSGGYRVTVSGEDMDLATHVWFGTTPTTTVAPVYEWHTLIEDKLHVFVPAVSRGGVVKLRAAGPAGLGPEGATFIYQRNLTGAVGAGLCTPFKTVGELVPST
jgi:streptogramin lyase